MPISKRCLAFSGLMALLTCAVTTCALTTMALADEAAPGQHHMISGQVTKVIDGDTLEVQVARRTLRVHINGVDAPEASQPWGKQAQLALAQMVLGQAVDLEPVGPDRGVRLTAIVFVGEAEVGAALVSDGNAWADRQDLRPSDIGLCEVEASAREQRRGLWSLPSAQRVAPWEYRMRFVHPAHKDYSAETADNCKSVALRKRGRKPVAPPPQAPLPATPNPGVPAGD
jgi:endonuclease YncB( thermonuclease family)